MSNSDKSLWPAFNFTEADLVSPTEIIQMQASAVPEMTSGLLSATAAQVLLKPQPGSLAEFASSLTNVQSEVREIRLELVSEDEYRFRLLTVQTTPELDWPATLRFDGRSTSVSGPQELRASLRTAFHSDKTQGIIRSLAKRTLAHRNGRAGEANS